MNDRIFVDNLRLNCRVGITSEERKEPQEVTMDISLFLNLKPAAESDSMGETIDYREVRQRVMQFISKREFKLLEALADGTATCLLDSFKAERVTVRVRKAKYSSDPSIGIEIVRDRR
ncbi:MAG: dihydroneopterin aldolase [Nitrososphaerota archaeon]|nr:dihydroneopterin aldolase [Nitrososphaerota archaeon]MDG6975212.1 dihydroneopterin aldolase [Nitrososphaerota archaeon]